MVTIAEFSCRVCLQEQDVMINIYDELEDLQTNLSNLLEICGDLQIDENDIFPKYLCEECTRELLISSAFREKCYKSKQMLSEILQENKESELNEEEHLNEIVKYDIEDLNNIIEFSDTIQENYTIEDIVQQQTPDVNVNHVLDESLLTTKKISVPLLSELPNDVNPSEIFVQNIDIVEDSKITVADSCSVYFDVNEPKLNKIYTEDRTLSDKIRRHLVFKCDICGVIYKQAINLQKHIQKTHAPLRSFNCEKCGYWFSLETSFQKHIQSCNYVEILVDNTHHKKKKLNQLSTHNMESDNDRKCVFCEREFPTPFALRMHLRSHTGERPFQCLHCIKSFKTQSALNVHSKRHTGQADYVCTVCNKTFYEQGNLSVHMRSHTGDRPHVCTVCNKKFTRVFLLQLHMRTHTGEKPFNCTYCDKSFRQTTDLRTHLTIHTGHKRYSCSLCSKSYMKRVDLIQHMRKHSVLAVHGENNETVPYEQIADTLTTDTYIDLNLQNSEVYSFYDNIESEVVILKSDDIR